MNKNKYIGIVDNKINILIKLFKLTDYVISELTFNSELLNKMLSLAWL